MSAQEAWPPAPSARDQWVLRPVGDPSRPGVEQVRLRLTRLWGRQVAVDERRRVWCPCHWQLIPVEELGRPDNSHLVGLPNRMDAQLVTDMDDGPSPSSNIWTAGF